MKQSPPRLGGTKRSRRGFLKLMAVGSAAMLATPAARLATAATKPKSPAGGRSAATAKEPPRPVAVRAEIDKQKRFTAQALKVVRDYPLPPGSPMALVFKPLKARRRKG